MRLRIVRTDFRVAERLVVTGQFQQATYPRLDLRKSQFPTGTANHPLRRQERGKPTAIAEGQRSRINDHMPELKCSEHEECPTQNIDVREVKFAL